MVTSQTEDVDKEEIEKNTKIIYEAERKRFEDEMKPEGSMNTRETLLVASLLL